MYCTCIPVVLINAVENAHESRGECHGNACNLFAPVVLLGPSGPWLRYPVMRFNARDWHRHLYANAGGRDCDADRVIEHPAGAACAVVTSGDVTCRVPPLNTISGPYSGQSIAITSHSHLPSCVVLPRTHSGDLTDSQKINYFVSFCAVSYRNSCIPVEATPVLHTGFKC